MGFKTVELRERPQLDIVHPKRQRTGSDATEQSGICARVRKGLRPLLISSRPSPNYSKRRRVYNPRILVSLSRAIHGFSRRRERARGRTTSKFDSITEGPLDLSSLLPRASPRSHPHFHEVSSFGAGHSLQSIASGPSPPSAVEMPEVLASLAGLGFLTLVGPLARYVSIGVMSTTRRTYVDR